MGGGLLDELTVPPYRHRDRRSVAAGGRSPSCDCAAAWDRTRRPRSAPCP